ncbi:ribosome recycling factor [Chitinibacter sp. SCUT-21]|uniref:ribosome recycling factor n=1 Tax=Chitinibacter sp. SCUT-21 TaxID=2970891 RepID=UPI0035A712BE
MIADIKKSTEEKMAKTAEKLKTDLAKIRTGRAHTGLLDHVQVEYYGSLVPVNQVANITLIDSRTIGAQPYEKNMVAKVEKAIRDCDLGLNPAAQGDLIRVPMPMLTEERRKDLIKVVRGETEDARVAVRNVRRDANDQLKRAVKDKEISEDDERRGTDEIQKLTDKYIADLDRQLAEKEKELLTV